MRPIIVFVAHGFALEDAPVVASVVESLRQGGVSVVTGELPESRAICTKVQERIRTSDIFVAVMTRRHWLEQQKTWTTSAWVIEEKGYSLGQNPNRPVVVLVEEGISVPTDIGGLGGDRELIFFTREHFIVAEEKLRQVITGLTSEYLSVSRPDFHLPSLS